MPRSTKMFVEQSHLTMPPSVWLHVNGVSLTTDIPTYQPPVHSYDYRTKHLQSPVQPPTPPLVSPSGVVPCSITMIDSPYFNMNQNRPQVQRIENTDLPKKCFIDRQIKKARSLPGLIKGTALSRHTPLQSSTFASPAPANPSANTIQDDQLPIIPLDNEDDSLPVPQTNEPPPETRRPRVYFSDFNKIQFIEDTNESFQQQSIHNNHYPHRRHRSRAPKKPSQPNGVNQLSPSIQQTQILQNFPRPTARQPTNQSTQELNIKKQQILASPRAHSSRSILLPDILNQSLNTDTSINESSNKKYHLQREKPLVRLSKPVIEIPSAFSIDIPSEDTLNNTSSMGNHESHIPNHDCELNEKSNDLSLQNTPSISITSINRQRPSLRTISLRQQFVNSNKPKYSSLNTNPSDQGNNSTLNARRSASLKQSVLRIPDDTSDLAANTTLIQPSENRPLTSTRTPKQLKRSDVIHFHSKNPLTTVQQNDLMKSHVYESAPDRFQNLLTIVRPPYASGGTNGTTFDPSIQPSNHHHQQQQHINSNHRPIRAISARGSITLPLTSNTVFV